MLYTQFLVKWDFDNKTQKSKGHGNCKTFNVEKSLNELQSSGSNPGNQHLRHLLNSSHAPHGNNFPIWGFKVQMALLMRPGMSSSICDIFFFQRMPGSNPKPPKKVSHIGSQHGLDGLSYLTLPDLVESCCICWQGCCKIYSVRQAWLNVSINQDLLDTILFCRTNACATSSFSKPIFTKKVSTKNVPKLQHGNGDEPLQAPGKNSTLRIYSLNQKHPSNETLQKGKTEKLALTPLPPNLSRFQDHHPKKLYPRNSMHCKPVDRMKRSLDCFWS